MDFTPVEEVERILMVDMAEKEARDFFREEWVEEPIETMSMEDLVVVVVGGGGTVAGGGGGGYSGGSSGRDRGDSCGGGGGSYNTGTNQQNDCCFNTAGHGHVAITFL